MKPSSSPSSINFASRSQNMKIDFVSYENDSSKTKDTNELSNLAIALQSIVYGLVVAIVLVPCMIGFCAIIFSDPIFRDFMPCLIKLVFVSSIVHQICFSCLSPLNFAIGQVQDAGLIFLSTMAASIVEKLQSDGVPVKDCVTTALIHLSISTLLLGLALMVTGRLKLASVVQYLPMPVVGGYLAFIGLFTLQAGIALMTNLILHGPSTWYQLLSPKPIILAFPGVFCGMLLILISKKYQHFSVLPASLLSIPLVFYFILLLTNHSLEDVQTYGWIGEPTPSTNLFQVYDLFNFNNVHWHVMLTQIPTWFGMYFVVAFSSSLDIAAIIMGTGSQLDYNEQLTTVGISNFFSGVAGGYTGSYIFSQTLFSFRTKTNSKILGIALASCELIVVALPISLMSFIPKFFFGSVMVFIGVDLLITWLITSYVKLLFREYVILILAFIMINIFGPQGGMMFGICFAAFSFIYEYSRVGVVKEVVKNSNVVRNLEQRDILCSFHRQIVTIELYGHIFFGSSIQILNGVKKAVKIQSHEKTSKKNKKKINILDEELPIMSLSSMEDNLVCLDGSKAGTDSLVTRFLILDFAHVSGVDATAVRSCFLTLKILAKANDIRTVYVNLKPDIEYLLRSNDVVKPNDANCTVSRDLDKGLEWAEELVLLEVSQQKGPKRGPSLWGKHITSLPELLRNCFGLPQEYEGLEILVPFFKQEDYSEGNMIFAAKALTDSFYLLVEGEVTLNTLPIQTLQCTERYPMELLRRVHPGCIFGDLDFFLEQPRSIEAIVTSPTACVYKMTRSSMKKLEISYPHMVILVQNAILKATLLNTKDSFASLVTS